MRRARRRSCVDARAKASDAMDSVGAQGASSRDFREFTPPASSSSRAVPCARARRVCMRLFCASAVQCEANGRGRAREWRDMVTRAVFPPKSCTRHASLIRTHPPPCDAVWWPVDGAHAASAKTARACGAFGIRRRRTATVDETLRRFRRLVL